MIQNDYRRQLIMLRGLDKGLTGHARLERRTMVGSLQFSVSGALSTEALYAALLTNARGQWQGSILGQLGRDSRGQAGLNVSFDPRNIDGLALEQYQLIAILQNGEDGGRLAMCGFANGSIPIDWAQIHDAAARILAPTNPPEPEVEPEPEPVPVTALPEEEAVEVFEQMPEPMILTVKLNEDGALEDSEGNTVEISNEQMPAGLLLDLDITEPWPDAIEQLRAIFLNETTITPFPLDGFVFVRAPLPTHSAGDYCAAGIKCEARAPAYVCYAIPGTDPADPPPGLEEYTWVTGEDGSGWWRLCLHIESGEVVDLDA